jgi:hypothetical protein
MSETTPHVEPAERRHAPYDLQLRPVVIFGAVLVGMIVLILLGLAWLFQAFNTRLAQQDMPPAPLAQTRPQLPPEPRLQVAPSQELQQMRAAEEALLHSYGWIDQAAGIARLPIDRAVTLLVERGLPAWPESPAGQSPAERGTPAEAETATPPPVLGAPEPGKGQ